jgi:hypothetical protein
VCFALSEVWLGLDFLAEAYAMTRRANHEEGEPNGAEGGGGDMLFDLLYASVALGN